MAGKPSHRITIKDLAREMGVSVATIARAFHPDADIAAATRAAVLRLAAERGYQPDALARSMITGRTRIVGVLVADLENPFYPQVLASLSSALQAAGFNTMLVVAEPCGSIDAALRLVLSYRPEYVISLATNLSAGAMANCATAGVPLMFFNRTPDTAETRAVVCDNRAAAAALAEHMLAAGMRRPGFMAGQTDTSTNRERREGFVTRCNEAGLEVMEEAAGQYGYVASQRAMRRLLTAAERPDGLFCASDIMALGAIDTARQEFGLRVPEDLLVAGFDDIAMSAWPTHDLTTVRQPITQMVEQCLAWVMSSTEAAAEPGTLRLPGTLIVRGTTKGGPARRNGAMTRQPIEEDHP